MSWIRDFLVRICGDDRNALHPDPAPTLRCAECHRPVTFIEKSLDEDEWIHADDASPICQPIGVYRAE
jgi:hypothetical protein